MARKNRTSRRISLAMPGRNIFTATTRPSARRALCTCAIEAAAIASSSKEVNSSGSGLCEESSIILIALLPENGGSLSCNCTNPPASSGPIKSALVASACPNLIKPGPNACSASHKACPASLRDFRPAIRKFSTNRRRQNQSGSISILARCPKTPARPKIKPVRGNRQRIRKISINPASSQNEWRQSR